MRDYFRQAPLEALKTFHLLISIATVNISERVADEYLKKFDETVYLLKEDSFKEAVRGFEHKLTSIALHKSNNKVSAAASRIGLSRQTFRNKLNTFPDLQSMAPVKERKSQKQKSISQKKEVFKTILFNDTELLLPHFIKPILLMNIVDESLSSLGLLPSTVAVCVKLVKNDDLPVIVKDSGSDRYFCGFPMEYWGMFGLMTDNEEPFLIKSENALTLGTIAGYCKLNEISNIYEFFTLGVYRKGSSD